MRRTLTLLLVAVTIVAVTATPTLANCSQECRLSSSGETICALGLDMVDCDVVTYCEWHQYCGTCGGYWLCQDACVGDRCLRA